jgi:hypothetical protein
VILLIGEVVHIGGAVDDYRDLLAPSGIGVSGGAGFGLYLAVVAGLVMAGGAAKNFMASRRPSGS